MGTKCCVIHHPQSELKLAKEQLGQVPLQEKELYMLHLIYSDLAQRVAQKTITMENFVLFFHKNGFWGQRLFKQFDYTDTNHIVEKEFIIGIAKLFKTNEQKKIELLFNEFSHAHKRASGQRQTQPSSTELEEGISFDNFLVMLYNYPKQDLKNVLNDKEFFQTQLRPSLKTIGENRRLQSVYKMGSYLERKKPLQCRIQQKSEVNDPNLATSTMSLGEYRSSYGSIVGRSILKNLRGKQSEQTIVKIQDQAGKIVQIKTNNFHHLVKKFAYRMFKQMNISKKSQKMTKQQFQTWILKHRKLYDTYYSGFHNEVWEIDDTTQRPMYLSCIFEKNSKAKYLHPSFLHQDKKMMTIQLILLHSILIITHEQDISDAFEVICLDGLAVNKSEFSSFGYQLTVTHRDGIYRKRQFVFQSQQLRDQWFKALQLFKGQSIESLYTMARKIGAGRFSVVYESIQKSTGRKYAVKVIESYKLQQDQKDLIAHETDIMQIFSHPLLVQYKQSIQTKTHLYIITQLCEGKDLFEFVKDYSCLTEYDSSVILQQVILGVMYMHSLGIIHRDLKPQNIMVSLDNQHIDKIKIIDFGFANYLDALQQVPPEQVLAGTPNYIAPQILRREKISYKIDIFALGSILYYMLSGSLPFNSFTLTEIFNKTLDNEYEYPEKLFEKISPQAQDLIDKLLQNEPQKRITLQNALKHPWFKVAKQTKNTQVRHKKVDSIKVF